MINDKILEILKQFGIKTDITDFTKFTFAEENPNPLKLSLTISKDAITEIKITPSNGNPTEEDKKLNTLIKALKNESNNLETELSNLQKILKTFLTTQGNDITAKTAKKAAQLFTSVSSLFSKTVKKETKKSLQSQLLSKNLSEDLLASLEKAAKIDISSFLKEKGITADSPPLGDVDPTTSEPQQKSDKSPSASAPKENKEPKTEEESFWQKGLNFMSSLLNKARPFLDKIVEVTTWAVKKSIEALSGLFNKASEFFGPKFTSATQCAANTARKAYSKLPSRPWSSKSSEPKTTPAKDEGQAKPAQNEGKAEPTKSKPSTS